VQRLAAGRVVIQAVGVLCGAPFVFLCCQTRSIVTVLVSLAAWGFFKGLYDANIFASLFDAVPVAARGVATGWMNTVGWMGGRRPCALSRRAAGRPLRTRPGHGSRLGCLSVRRGPAAVCAVLRPPAKAVLPNFNHNVTCLLSKYGSYSKDFDDRARCSWKHTIVASLFHKSWNVLKNYLTFHFLQN
jgi:hypothetical protein